MMCKKGEIRARLASYYVRLRDAGDTLCYMLQRLGGLGGTDNLVGLQNLGSNVLGMNTKNLHERWKKKCNS